MMSKGKAPAPIATPEMITEETITSAAPTVVRAKHDFWWPPGGIPHTPYKRHQLIFGREAEDLLKNAPAHVETLNSDVMALCYTCGAGLSAAILGAGQVMFETAHEALVEIGAEVRGQWHSVKPGDVVEVRCAREVAKEIVEGCRPGTVRAVEKRIVLAVCPACGGPDLYAMPK